MSKNNNLHLAKENKNDEFYTMLTDIEKELEHYKEHFNGKTVYCNCDDCYESNFFKFFMMNFKRFGLKRLIATCYKESKMANREIDLFNFDETVEEVHGYKIDITGFEHDVNKNIWDEIKEVTKASATLLNGSGDFRSDECVELLKQADIVVTNPPFSCYICYISQLIEYNKQFLILGNKNAITYKEIFPLIKDDKIWLGYNSPTDFKLPNGETTKSVSGLCRWFTNLTHNKRNEELILYRTYNEKDYPHYDNYDAINVDKVSDIPMDYEGVMGVPITFIDKYNPEQFEILGITQRNDDPYKTKKYTKKEYANANDLNARGCILVDGVPKSIYPRILIRKRGN